MRNIEIGVVHRLQRGKKNRFGSVKTNGQTITTEVCCLSTARICIKKKKLLQLTEGTSQQLESSEHPVKVGGNKNDQTSLLDQTEQVL